MLGDVEDAQADHHQRHAQRRVHGLLGEPKDLIDHAMKWLGKLVEGSMSEGPLPQPARGRGHRGGRRRAGVSAADPDAVSLHRLSGRLRLHGARRVPHGPAHEQGGSARPRFIPMLSLVRLRDSRHHGHAHDREPPDRLTTILVAPLMTCSARLPVYTLLIGAFIPDQRVFGKLARPDMCARCICGDRVALSWRGCSGRRCSKADAPAHHGIADIQVARAARRARQHVGPVPAFLRRAGTVILTLTILLWFLATYPKAPGRRDGPAIYYSYAGRIGLPSSRWLGRSGFDWRIAVALIPGFAAREVMVSALATVYAVEGR